VYFECFFRSLRFAAKFN